MKKRNRKRIKTMDVILIIISIFLLIFVVVMIILFIQFQMVPDTLITAVFGICGGECGIMGWIRTTKDKKLDRKYVLQDRKAEDTTNKEEM